MRNIATIDNLSIEISASAQKANQEIDKLVQNIGKLANSLKIDTSGLEKIGKSLNLTGVEKATKSVDNQMQKVSKTLSQIEQQYANLGKGFELKGSTTYIQKQIDNLTNKLANAKLKKDEFEKSGAIHLLGYENAAKDVIKYTNQIESLKKQLSKIQTDQPQLNLKITGVEKATKHLIEYKKHLIDFKNDMKSISNIYGGFSNVSKGFLDSPIQDLKRSIEELKQSYPQATNVISAFEKELQKLQVISRGLTKEPTKVNIDTSSLDRVNEKIIELKNKFEKSGLDFKFTGNSEQLNIEIEKVYSKLNELKTKEKEMISAGKVDTSEFEKLQESIAKIGNKFGILDDLRNRTEEFRNQLKQLQIPTIREENLTKLQSSLENAKTKMASLKAEMANKLTTGKIIENVDDSGYKNLREQIALTGKTIDALQGKIKEVSEKTKISSAEMAEKFKNNLSNLQVPPIREENLAKLQNELKKTEKETEKLRIQLSNAITIGKITPNVDDSGFRKLTEQIVLSEKQAEALRNKIQEVGGDTGKTGSMMDRLKSSLSNVSNHSNKASSATNMLERNIKKLSSSMSGFSASAGKAISGMKSFTKQVLSAMGIYLGIYGAIRGIKKSIDISSDLTEIQNVVDVTFGDMAYKVEELSKTSIEQFGMSEIALKQYSSRFQAMGSAMGISSESISKANSFLEEQTNGYIKASDSMSDVSLNLTKLTADMASFYNVEQKAVAEDLAAIFTGQTRPLKLAA